jgi:hypothetical protein
LRNGTWGKGKQQDTSAPGRKPQREVISGEFDVLVVQRVQIAPSQFRIPDLCLVQNDDQGEVVQSPPVLWIEVLSPEGGWGTSASQNR